MVKKKKKPKPKAKLKPVYLNDMPKFNFCAVCGKYFETKAELASHSHKEAA
jgi:hypothetical protein